MFGFLKKSKDKQSNSSEEVSSAPAPEVVNAADNSTESAAATGATEQINFADSLLTRRYEIKYLIPLAKAKAIEQYVASYLPIDRYSKLHPDGFYPIVSLYIDSPDLLLCRESMTGVSHRYKLRIRSYSDDAKSPRFCEIKRRANVVIIKSRARIRTEDVPQFLASRRINPVGNSPKDSEALQQFQLYAANIKAMPIIRIRYLRKAYEGATENRVRITFDKELCFNCEPSPAVLLGDKGWQQNNISLQSVILEIKFTGRFPAWLYRMVEYFNIQQRPVSKYTSSIKNACLLKFCAPKLPIRA